MHPSRRVLLGQTKGARVAAATPPAAPPEDVALLAIARACFSGVTTFEPANHDGTDFKDCHIVSIRDALRAAYALGRSGL